MTSIQNSFPPVTSLEELMERLMEKAKYICKTIVAEIWALRFLLKQKWYSKKELKK